MYSPGTLEEERLSWRPVVYYNIVRPIRRIFEVVDAYAELDYDEMNSFDGPGGTPDSTGASSSSTGDHSIDSSSVERELSTLRLRLSPLLATEPSLAERLSGGNPSAAPSAKGNLLVRSGWQLLGKAKRDRSSYGGRTSLDAAPRRSEDSSRSSSHADDKLIEEVTSILSACKDDVRELWEHPHVRKLREKRRLRLEEWAEL